MPLVQQNHVFIDPESCGSSVGYHIHVNEWTPSKGGKTEHSIRATVVLADCSRKVDWSFDGDDSATSNLPKIDAAIQLLQEFRKKYADTEKLVKQLNK